ncbi:hypothetical protein GALMADRAFT_224015 [Galerina marginata CBS 339.88]|uniref:Uncharacterized protein n=1 Tax=Galerina marginata (strain CBS 339.88) TaxID=685588 RepID=A0A067T6K0_GALM3|nr:hypothetical protein GALMADRAFT_224015 [Galerina marginata CBS 339.88]
MPRRNNQSPSSLSTGCLDQDQEFELESQESNATSPRIHTNRYTFILAFLVR